ncbi:ABC transporter substrate-binding protein [Halorussus litoreus]|uniref:ABC transporter substrate-binding protein n=1 Tax=Halorussus litoreus TaxID=1710536 RepID=UPI000E26ACFE|nr:ABC transporter substrate-binding protein [Halorussus litoreus]
MVDDTNTNWLTPSRRRVLSGLGGAGAVSLAGCMGGGDSEDQETTEDGGDDTTESSGGDTTSDDGGDGGDPTTVSIGITNGGWDLIPARDTDFDSNKVYTLIYDNVVNLNSDAEVVPDLASDWSRESDTQFVFELEEGVTFHNGEDFTADDVKYTYDWIQNNENPRKNYVAAVEDVVVENDTTVRFDLSEPYAPFLYKVHAVMWPLSETAMNEYGDDYNQNPVGTGPFELTSWDSGNKAVLEKYDDYWKEGEPNIDRIEFRILPEDSSKVAQLEAGSIDLLDRMPAQFTDRVENSGNASVITTGGVSSGRIDFNTDVEPLGDRKVRRAIAWALDKQQITQTVLQGYGTPAKSVLPNSLPQYNDSISDFNHPNGDAEQAQSLLDDAGYNDLSLTIKTSTSSRHERTATLVQSMLGQVGIDASIQTLEGNAFFSQETEGDYEIAISNWTWFGDPDTLLYLYHTDGLNVWNISNEELDGLLEEQRRTVDPEARGEIINEIQKIVYDEAYSVYTYYPDRIQGISNRIEGYEQYANGSFRSLDSASVN